jgi:hypothetical protein
MLVRCLRIEDMDIKYDDEHKLVIKESTAHRY